MIYTYKTSIVKAVVYEVEVESNKELTQDEVRDMTIDRIENIEDDDYGIYVKDRDYFDFDIDAVKEDDSDEID